MTITSFGYKHGKGAPEADLTFDVRDLPNPHRHYPDKDGRDVQVVRAVMGGQGERRVREIVNRVRHYEAITSFLPSIAIGCTGGRHRSVVIAEAVGKLGGWGPVVHRDLPGSSSSSGGGCSRQASHSKRARDSKRAH